MAKLAGLNVSVDGSMVAQLKSPRFTCVTVAAGQHTVSAGFGGLAGPQNKPSELVIDAPAGGIVALRMTMAMGMRQNGIAIAQQTDIPTVPTWMAGTSPAMTGESRPRRQMSESKH